MCPSGSLKKKANQTSACLKLQKMINKVFLNGTSNHFFDAAATQSWVVVPHHKDWWVASPAMGHRMIREAKMSQKGKVFVPKSKMVNFGLNFCIN